MKFSNSRESIIFGDKTVHSQQQDAPPNESFGILIGIRALVSTQLEAFQRQKYKISHVECVDLMSNSAFSCIVEDFYFSSNNYQCNDTFQSDFFNQNYKISAGVGGTGDTTQKRETGFVTSRQQLSQATFNGTKVNEIESFKTEFAVAY